MISKRKQQSKKEIEQKQEVQIMEKKHTLVQKVGSWSFLVGIVIAMAAGFWELNALIVSVLIVLGMVKEQRRFCLRQFRWLLWQQLGRECLDK